MGHSWIKEAGLAISVGAGPVEDQSSGNKVWTFSAHTTNIRTQTLKEVFASRPPHPHPQPHRPGALPFLHASGSMVSLLWSCP